MMGWDVSKCTQKIGQEYPGKETLEALRLLHLEKKDLVDMMAGFKRLTEGMRRKNLTYFCLSERGRYGARGQELHWSWSKFFMRKTFLAITAIRCCPKLAPQGSNELAIGGECWCRSWEVKSQSCCKVFSSTGVYLKCTEYETKLWDILSTGPVHQSCAHTAGPAWEESIPDRGISIYKSMETWRGPMYLRTC